MFRAAIDLGTQTCLLLVVEWDASSHQVKQVLADEARMVRLGEGVDQGRAFQLAPMHRALACLKEYAKRVGEFEISPDSVVCVATSQARDAKNSQEFFLQVQSETGFRFQVISGEQEAQVTFLGALLPGMDPAHTCVIDIGGGSTEIISREGVESVNLGSVRFTERFLKSDPVTDAEFRACQFAIDEELRVFLPWRSKLVANPTLVAVAGTATTLAAWNLNLQRFDPAQVDAVVLSRDAVCQKVEELKRRTLYERKALPCMEPLRADVILAGAMILWRVLELLQFSECRVSTRGLRYGLLQKALF